MRELIALIQENCTKLQIRQIKNDLLVFKHYGSATYHIRTLKNGYFRCNVQDVNAKGKTPKGIKPEQIIIQLNILFPKPKQ